MGGAEVSRSFCPRDIDRFAALGNENNFNSCVVSSYIQEG